MVGELVDCHLAYIKSVSGCCIHCIKGLSTLTSRFTRRLQGMYRILSHNKPFIGVNCRGRWAKKERLDGSTKELGYFKIGGSEFPRRTWECSLVEIHLPRQMAS